MGRNKALLPLPDGRCAVEAVLSVARQVAGRVFLAVDIAEHGAQVYGALSWRPALIMDEIPDAGPLAALTGVLHATSASAVLVLAVDTPLLVPDVLQILHQAWLETGHHTNAIAAPLIAGMVQPMPACYAARLGDVADGLLASGARSLRALVQSAGAHLRVVDEQAFRSADPSLRSFARANTPAEWKTLLVQAGQRDG
jgi:molybdopterin-guanine dinucleotide biosynthesis protein A